MSLMRPEPGEYGYKGEWIAERYAPRKPGENFGPAIPGRDGVSGDEPGAAYMAREVDVEFDLPDGP
jgi:hypothetical protein